MAERSSHHLQIQMLGELSLRIGDRVIRDHDNRSRKVWLLLAYMIYFRNRSISKEELIELFWSDEDSSANPVNALKALFHRIRNSLDQLEPGCGKNYLLYQHGEYKWNNDMDFSVDVDEFEELIRKSRQAKDPEARLRLSLRAVEVYRGDFLSKFSTESWVLPNHTYFHRVYLETVQECLTMLRERERLSDIVSITQRAVLIEPSDETLYYHLMRALLDLGDMQAVQKIYDSMSASLFSRFGVMPSDEIRSLYREALRKTNELETDLSSILEDLREERENEGAFLCDYDFFKVIYQLEARSVARSGDAVHLCLISVAGSGKRALSKRSLDLCMDNLGQIILSTLRSGDAVTRCSLSQFLIMLPRANYENSTTVMERVLRAFYRQYPHSPASLRYMVQPLEPFDN